MKRVLQLIVGLMLLVLPVLPVHSARVDSYSASSTVATTCPDIVKRAWDNVDQLCYGVGRNEACYGHVLLDAQPRPDVERFVFDAEGHIVDVVELQSLRLSAMDLLEGTWGVALMQIQANLPAATAEDENVSLLLFGDVEVTDASPTLPTIEVGTISPVNWINVRYRPTTQSPVIGTIAPDEVVVATGRLENSSWLRVELPDVSMSGWVYASLIESADDTEFDTLGVVDPGASYFGPMQAFYFRSGAQDAACPEAPNSGILIQTPEGVAEVTLLINEVDIQLGSTVYFQSDPGNELTVSVVEGHARVTSGGVSRTAVAGTQISVPLDQNMKPTGEPSLPRPYDMANLQGLPVDHIGIPVVVGEPLAQEEVDALIEQDEALQDDASVPNDEDGDGKPDGPPGLVDNPGLGDSVPPGQNGSPPGQDDKDEKPPKDDKDKD